MDTDTRKSRTNLEAINKDGSRLACGGGQLPQRGLAQRLQLARVEVSSLGLQLSLAERTEPEPEQIN